MKNGRVFLPDELEAMAAELSLREDNKMVVYNILCETDRISPEAMAAKFRPPSFDIATILPFAKVQYGGKTYNLLRFGKALNGTVVTLELDDGGGGDILELYTDSYPGEQRVTPDDIQRLIASSIAKN